MPLRSGNGMHGMTVNTIVSGGCIISGSHVANSVFFSDVRVHSFCHIQDAVVLPGVTIPRNCRLRKVVIDRGCVLPESLVIGEDAALDAKRFERSEGGVVLVTQPMLDRLPPPARAA
jgi:glucose-1-phosphate adenylyltransferase